MPFILEIISTKLSRLIVDSWRFFQEIKFTIQANSNLVFNIGLSISNNGELIGYKGLMEVWTLGDKSFIMRKQIYGIWS